MLVHECFFSSHNNYQAFHSSINRMDRAQFYKEVYSITKEIPYGNVFTYGKIAQLIGNPPIFTNGRTGFISCTKRRRPSLPPGSKQPRKTSSQLAETKRIIGKRRNHLQAQWMRQHVQTLMGHYWFTHIDNRY